MQACSVLACTHQAPCRCQEHQPPVTHESVLALPARPDAAHSDNLPATRPQLDTTQDTLQRPGQVRTEECSAALKAKGRRLLP